MSEEIGVIKEQLRLQTLLDEYKDDLIKTMMELIDSKDLLIGQLRESINSWQLKEANRL